MSRFALGDDSVRPTGPGPSGRPRRGCGLTAEEPVFLIVSVEGELFVRVSRVSEHGDPVTLTSVSGVD